MTKAEAFDILAGRIRDLCLTDLIYADSEEKGCTESMIAALSCIDTTEQLLTEFVERGVEQDGYSDRR